jgi:hypothetical protein
MVRRRAGAVSNHAPRSPSFETREDALLRMRPFRVSDSHFKQLVAWIERSEIRGGQCRIAKPSPDFTAFNPGYEYKRDSSFSRHDASEVCKLTPPQIERGRSATSKKRRRECRVSDAPVVWAKNARVFATGSPVSTGIPCTMVLRFPSRSPWRPGFVVTIIPEKP